jgi:hypothetical protein
MYLFNKYDQVNRHNNVILGLPSVKKYNAMSKVFDSIQDAGQKGDLSKAKEAYEKVSGYRSIVSLNNYIRNTAFLCYYSFAYFCYRPVLRLRHIFRQLSCLLSLMPFTTKTY